MNEEEGFRKFVWENCSHPNDEAIDVAISGRSSGFSFYWKIWQAALRQSEPVNTKDRDEGLIKDVESRISIVENNSLYEDRPMSACLLSEARLLKRVIAALRRTEKEQAPNVDGVRPLLTILSPEQRAVLDVAARYANAHYDPRISLNQLHAIGEDMKVATLAAYPPVPEGEGKNVLP